MHVAADLGPQAVDDLVQNLGAAGVHADEELVLLVVHPRRPGLDVGQVDALVLQRARRCSLGFFMENQLKVSAAPPGGGVWVRTRCSRALLSTHPSFMTTYLGVDVFLLRGWASGSAHYRLRAPRPPIWIPSQPKSRDTDLNHESRFLLQFSD